MNKILWILQSLLAIVFLAHGLFLLFPPASMLEQLSVMPIAFRLFLGVAEVLAAVGLTLPGLTGIMPAFVPAAAVGIMIVMASAIVFHVSRGEIGPAMTTLILFVMATFVAFGRWKLLPIAGSHRPIAG